MSNAADVKVVAGAIQGQKRGLVLANQNADFSTRKNPDERLRRVTHSPDGSIVFGPAAETTEKNEKTGQMAQTKREGVKSGLAKQVTTNNCEYQKPGLKPSSPATDSVDIGKVSFSLTKKNLYVASAAVFTTSDPAEIAEEAVVVLPRLEERLSVDAVIADDPKNDKQQAIFCSFLEVKNKDETKMLNWPVDMIQYTTTKPIVSFSCNPLMVDLAALLRKSRSTDDNRAKLEEGTAAATGKEIGGLSDGGAAKNDDATEVGACEKQTRGNEDAAGEIEQKGKKRKKKHKRKKSANKGSEVAVNETTTKKHKHKKHKRKHKKKRVKDKLKAAVVADAGETKVKKDSKSCDPAQVKEATAKVAKNEKARKRNASEKSEGPSPSKKLKKKVEIDKDKDKKVENKDRHELKRDTKKKDNVKVEVKSSPQHNQQKRQPSEAEVESRLLDKMKRLKSSSAHVKSENIVSMMAAAALHRVNLKGDEVGKLNNVAGGKAVDAGSVSKLTDDAPSSKTASSSWSKMEDIFERNKDSQGKKPSWETSSESEGDEPEKAGRSKLKRQLSASDEEEKLNRSNSRERTRSGRSGSAHSSYTRSRSPSSYRSTSYSRSRSYTRSRSSRYSSSSRSHSPDSRRSRSYSRHRRSRSSSHSRSRSTSYTRSRSRSSRSASGGSRSRSVDAATKKPDRANEGKNRSDLLNPIDIPLPKIGEHDENASPDRRLRRIKETKERLRLGTASSEKRVGSIPLPPVGEKLRLSSMENMKNLENLPVIDYTRPPPPVFGPPSMPDGYQTNPLPPSTAAAPNRGSKQSGDGKDPPLPPPKSPPPKPPPDEAKNPEAMQVDIDPEQAEQYRQLQKQAHKHARKLRKQRRDESEETVVAGDETESEEEDEDEEEDQAAVVEAAESKSEAGESAEVTDIESLMQQGLLEAAMRSSPTVVYANQSQLLAAGMPLQAGTPLMYPYGLSAGLPAGLIPQSLVNPLSPGLFHPAMQHQQLLIHPSGLQMSGLQMPGLQMSGLQMPGLQMPGLQMSGLQMPGLQMPGLIPMRQMIHHPLLAAQSQPLYRILRPPW